MPTVQKPWEEDRKLPTWELASEQEVAIRDGKQCRMHNVHRLQDDYQKQRREDSHAKEDAGYGGTFVGLCSVYEGCLEGSIPWITKSCLLHKDRQAFPHTRLQWLAWFPGLGVMQQGEGSYGLWSKRCPGLCSTLPPVTQSSQRRPFSFTNNGEIATGREAGSTATLPPRADSFGERQVVDAAQL